MPKAVTNEEFIEKLHNVNSYIKPLEDYVKANKKIKFQCLIDNNVFESTPNNVLRGHGCPICGKIKCLKESHL